MNTPTEKNKERDSVIQKQLESRYYDARGRFYIRAFSLFSMSLLFAGASIGCPPLIIIATVLSYIAVTGYLCNYGYKAIQSVPPASTTNKNMPKRRYSHSDFQFFKEKQMKNEFSSLPGLYVNP